MKVSEKVATLVEPIVEQNGAYLIDAGATAQGNRKFVRIVVQNLAGITMDEIAQITRSVNVSNALDELFPEGYHLEVSSPGIDYKLREYRDFPRNIGRTLRMYHRLSALPSPFSGILREVTEEVLVLEVNGNLHNLPFSDLDYAKVEIKW
ncbi:MAG TPA: hypothetical protein ENN20_07485 [Candidatus Marinimicrobia bacterium]|nr:hypothetical protein [Candidatus Neomarinimicrobiota bacterium]